MINDRFIDNRYLRLHNLFKSKAMRRFDVYFYSGQQLAISADIFAIL